MLYGIHTVAGLENFLCTRKTYHTWFFQTLWTLKVGCLPFYNLLYYYDSIFQKLVLCQKVLMYLEVFLWTERKTERFRYDLKKKKNFRDFRVFDFALYPRSKARNDALWFKKKKLKLPSFWICPITKIENSEI